MGQGRPRILPFRNLLSLPRADNPECKETNPTAEDDVTRNRYLDEFAQDISYSATRLPNAISYIVVREKEPGSYTPGKMSSAD